MKKINATERENDRVEPSIWMVREGLPILKGNIKAKSQNEEKAHVSQTGEE